MRLPGLIIFLSVCGLFLACSRASKDHTETATVSAPKKLKIARQGSPSSYLSNEEADAILKRVNSLLSTNDGLAGNNEGDVPCPVELSRDGDVKITHGPKIIDTPEDFFKVCSLEGFVHVVDQINFCPGVKNPGGSILGCTDLNSRKCMVVTRPVGNFTADKEDVVWAHEYAHTRRVYHPCEDCEPKYGDKLMHPIAAVNRRKVTPAECAEF